MAPNVRPEGGRLAAGPPLGMALMVTDGPRLWLAWDGAVATLLLLTMVGAMAGTAGWMGPFPFTGETEALLPCCAVCGAPTATGGAALEAI